MGISASQRFDTPYFLIAPYHLRFSKSFIFLSPIKQQSARFGDKDELKLQSLQTEYGFNTIAIGNGTACRESETAVAKMIGEYVYNFNAYHSKVNF